MITTNVIPVGTAAAGSQTLVVEATEGLCRPYCNLGANPTATMSFTTGKVQVVGTYAIVQIIVTTTIVTSDGSKCGKASTQTFTESFDVGFTATTSNTITLTPGTRVTVSPAQSRCCMAHAVKASTTLGIAIS